MCHLLSVCTERGEQCRGSGGRIGGTGAFEQLFHCLLPVCEPDFNAAGLVLLDAGDMEQVELFDLRISEGLFGENELSGIICCAERETREPGDDEALQGEGRLCSEPGEIRAAGGHPEHREALLLRICGVTARAERSLPDIAAFEIPAAEGSALSLQIVHVKIDRLSQKFDCHMAEFRTADAGESVSQVPFNNGVQIGKILHVCVQNL